MVTMMLTHHGKSIAKQTVVWFHTIIIIRLYQGPPITN